jgi:hypothetical protein
MLELLSRMAVTQPLIINLSFEDHTENRSENVSIILCCEYVVFDDMSPWYNIQL